MFLDRIFCSGMVHGIWTGGEVSQTFSKISVQLPALAMGSAKYNCFGSISFEFLHFAQLSFKDAWIFLTPRVNDGVMNVWSVWGFYDEDGICQGKTGDDDVTHC